MLEWNRRRIQNLTGTEQWLFIIGRVLVGFALGELTALYFPDFSHKIVIPVLVIGMLILVIPVRGMFRQKQLE